MSIYGQPRYISRAHATTIITALNAVGFAIKSVQEYGSDSEPMMDLVLTTGMSDDEQRLRSITINIRYKSPKER